MSINSTWTPLRSSSSRDVVLCIDFHTTGRPEAGFPDLVAQLRHDTNYWLISPPAVRPDADAAVGEYLRSWLAPVLESGLKVRAVLGFCVGAVYATGLADGLTESQGEAPELILLDPEQTQVGTLQYQLTKVITMLNSVLSDEDAVSIHAKLGELAGLEGMGLRRYAKATFSAFREYTEGAFERAGFDPEYAAEMLDLFSTFVTYLSIADDLDPRPRWASATALSSTSQDRGLNRLRATGELGTGEFVAHEITFDTDHDELLRAPGVAETVDKLLER